VGQGASLAGGAEFTLNELVYQKVGIQGLPSVLMTRTYPKTFSKGVGALGQDGLAKKEDEEEDERASHWYYMVEGCKRYLLGCSGIES